jgi:hypothetical protein
MRGMTHRLASGLHRPVVAMFDDEALVIEAKHGDADERHFVAIRSRDLGSVLDRGSPVRGNDRLSEARSRRMLLGEGLEGVLARTFAAVHGLSEWVRPELALVCVPGGDHVSVVPDPPAHPCLHPRAGRFSRVHRPMVRDWIVRGRTSAARSCQPVLTTFGTVNVC